MGAVVTCQCCGREFFSNYPIWWICDKCGYRICAFCLTVHKGKYGSASKCSQCTSGWLKEKNKSEKRIYN